MSKVQIICIGIMAVCTLIMIASMVWKEYEIRKYQKIVWSIGKYDKEANKKNRAFLVGKGVTRGEESRGEE